MSAQRPDYLELHYQLYRYGQEELERRRKAPVHLTAEFIETEMREGSYKPYLVDPRVGSNQRWFRFWITRGSRGKGKGPSKGWGFGHRHTVEAIIYIMRGRGYSLIDGVKQPWEAGDFICVPVFGWHKHVPETDEGMQHMAVTTGPFAMAMGHALYESEQYPEYWVYAQGGEEARKTLIPGAAEGPTGWKVQFDPSQWNLTDKDDNKLAPARLYYEQLAWAQEEEKRRRAGKVIARWKDLQWGSTPMGQVAYVIDPRLGFYVKMLGALVAEIPPGKHSGAHRHLYEETNYVLSGQGYSIIEDKRYDWKRGDVLVIPVFAWHQYFNTGNEPARMISFSNRVAMESTGYVHTQHGEPADY